LDQFATAWSRNVLKPRLTSNSEAQKKYPNISMDSAWLELRRERFLVTVQDAIRVTLSWLQAPVPLQSEIFWRFGV
jgi:hypothetical protein